MEEKDKIRFNLVISMEKIATKKQIAKDFFDRKLARRKKW